MGDWAPWYAGHVVLHAAEGRTNFKGLADFEDVERQEANKRCRTQSEQCGRVCGGDRGRQLAMRSSGMHDEHVF